MGIVMAQNEQEVYPAIAVAELGHFKVESYLVNLLSVLLQQTHGEEGR